MIQPLYIADCAQDGIEDGNPAVRLGSLAAGLWVLEPHRQRRGKASSRLRGLLARISPEAPAPIELGTAGALVPAPYGQNDDSSDRKDHEIARHVTFRGARTGAPFPLIRFIIWERTRRG